VIIQLIAHLLRTLGNQALMKCVALLDHPALLITTCMRQKGIEKSCSPLSA
jgi:hypothetical protein